MIDRAELVKIIDGVLNEQIDGQYDDGVTQNGPDAVYIDATIDLGKIADAVLAALKQEAT